MKTTIYFSILLLIVFTIQSCKKDPIDSGIAKSLVWEQSGCDEIFNAPTTPIIIDYTIQEGSQFQFPTFNPNNSNEIIYFEREANSEESPSSIGRLVKYNYQSGLKTVLVNDVEITGTPSWNTNGWIAFETQTSHIYIVRDNGADLTQFTTHGWYNGYNQHVSWLNGGNTLLWKYQNEAIGNNYLLQKMIDQQETDTLYHGNLGVVSVSNTNVLLSAYGMTFSIIQLNQNPLSSQEFQSTTGGFIFDGLCWNPTATKFYTSQIGSHETAGLFEVDFATGVATRIVQYCDRELIKSISCSPNGNFLIIEKLEREQKLNSEGYFEGTVIENSNIWLLNTSTFQEAKLPL